MQEKWFRQIPCWWVDSSFPRAIAGDPILLEHSKEWPDFIHADDVSSEIYAHIQEINHALSAKANARVREQTRLGWQLSQMSEFGQKRTFAPQ